jgi:hypothetical protein
LFHEWRRAGGDGPFEDFERALGDRPLLGLLPRPTRWDGAALPSEWNAYFPRGVLVVDRAAILDLFVASGIMTTARIAVVCVDGSPANVVDWLGRGFRRGQRAPVAYLHDAATAFYPFAVEPLVSLVAAAAGDPIDFHDLGLPVVGAPARRFPFIGEPWCSVPKRERIRELEALPPCALIAYAARRLMARVPGDPKMAPLARRTTPTERGRT